MKMRAIARLLTQSCRPLWPLVLLRASAFLHAAETDRSTSTKPPQGQNIPQMVEADGKLRLSFGEERLVLPRGLQPSMLCTKSGALVVQAQVAEKPFPAKRMTYPWAMETRVSRDDGKTWAVIP